MPRVTLYDPECPHGEFRRVDLESINRKGTVDIDGRTWKLWGSLGIDAAVLPHYVPVPHLTEEDKRPRATFEINGEEWRTFEAWKKEHNKTCELARPNAQGAIGGRFSFMFTGSSIGTFVKALCACGEEHLLTNTHRM